jgi:hypothetical protein
MMGDEAPAATTCGVNGETECDREEAGSGAQRLTDFYGAVRPASLLRKSILDESQRAPVAAGCTAPFKSRASFNILKYQI